MIAGSAGFYTARIFRRGLEQNGRGKGSDDGTAAYIFRR